MTASLEKPLKADLHRKNLHSLRIITSCVSLFACFFRSPTFIQSSIPPMMSKYLFLAATCISLLTSSCNSPAPQRYFDVAVLSANMISDFGGRLEYEMEHPSVTLLEGTKDQTRPMKRSEIIDQKINIVEDHLKDIKDLKETDDS